MVMIKENRNDADTLHVDDRNPQVSERADRLRRAVKGAGGNQAVAIRAGMPVGTLNRYLAGREMKASAMISLAAACNVSLEWLATGREPVRADQPTPTRPAPEPQSRSSNLFGTIDIDRMAQALDKAFQLYAERGSKPPSMRRLAQVLLLVYDDFTDETAPERAPEVTSDKI
jgi:hypothetical protein